MRLHIALLLILPAVVDCGCSDSKGGHSTAPPPSACPARAELALLVEPIQIVGDGSAASCTETALREAVEALSSEGGGSISFDCGAEHTIVLTEELMFEADAVIDGGGEITLSGGGATRIINTDHYVNLVVQDIAITDASTEESGAGIHMPWFGTLAVIDVTFTQCETTSAGSDIGGGAIYAGGLSRLVVSGCTFDTNRGSNGGAIVVNGSNMTIVDSVFSTNEAFGHGGGGSGMGGIGGAVYIDGMNREAVEPFVMCRTSFTANVALDHAGAVFRYSYPGAETTISDCTFDHNEVGSTGTGLAILYHEAAPLNLINSTFSFNTSDNHASGVFITSDEPASITNCTFVGNTTDQVGGAIFSAHTPITITNCTFADHWADYGPAIYSEDPGAIVIENSIFSGNNAGGEYNGRACCITFDSGAGNLQWPAQRDNGGDDRPCTPTTAFADALLDPLGDNGGHTPTMAPAEGSPAIDGADGCPETDQRGEPRSDPCDIGALEVE